MNVRLNFIATHVTCLVQIIEFRVIKSELRKIFEKPLIIQKVVVLHACMMMTPMRRTRPSLYEKKKRMKRIKSRL